MSDLGRAIVTDQQSELDRKIQTDKFGKQAGRPVPQSGASKDAIVAGLEFLFSVSQHAYWSLCGPQHESAAWVTSYVLGRLAEVPSQHITFVMRRKIEQSLDWLLENRSSCGGWAFEGAPSTGDADSTAWAITALRQHGRLIPQEALELIQRCRRDDGGFALYPDAARHGEIARLVSPDVTAISVRALGLIDAAASEFLASHLRTDVKDTPCRLSSIFFVSSTLLDWERGMAPWFVANAARELASRQTGESAWEKSLQLRCLMRLRMQSAWALSASLRRLQQSNGSWPGSAQLVRIAPVTGVQPAPHFDEHGIMATATAVSALAMSDLQPGLYFGSDLPFRRL